MSIRRTVIAVVVVAAALAGGALYVRMQARQAMEAGLAAFRAALPPGSTLTYATAAPDLLSGSAQLTGVTLTMGPLTCTAAVADIAPQGNDRLRHIGLRDLHVSQAGSSVSVRVLEADGVSAPAGPVDPKTIVADHLALQDIAFTGFAGPDALSVGTLTLDSYGAGRASTLNMAAIGLHLPGGSFDEARIDRFRLGGFDFSRFLPPASSPSLAALQDAGVQFSGLSVMARGHALATVETLDAGWRVVAPDIVATHAAVTGVVLARSVAVAPPFGQFGYDGLRASLALEGVVDRAARRLRIDHLDVDAPGMARAHLALALDNLPPDLLQPGPAADAFQLGVQELIGLQLRSAALRYDEASLFGRLRDAMAAARNQSPAEATAFLQDWVRRWAARTGLPDPVVAPVLGFIADPHRLSVKLDPPQPVLAILLPALLGGSASGVVHDPQQALGLRVTSGP